jgi:hypothetical protein
VPASAAQTTGPAASSAVFTVIRASIFWAQRSETGAKRIKIVARLDLRMNPAVERGRECMKSFLRFEKYGPGTGNSLETLWINMII